MKWTLGPLAVGALAASLALATTHYGSVNQHAGAGSRPAVSVAHAAHAGAAVLAAEDCRWMHDHCVCTTGDATN
jgi:hypothetical protein